MYLYYVEKYRVFALFIVVTGHVLYGMGIDPEGRIEKVIFNLFSGGTFFFVFISGFLFSYLNQSYFNYSKFLKKKLAYLLMPYLVLGIAPILFYILHADPRFGGYFLPSGDNIFERYIWPSIKYVVTGRFMMAYWYIPFILIMFLLAPLHLRFAKMSSRSQVAIIVVFGVISLLVHRPIWLINTFHSVLYYTSVYLLGIYVAVHQDVVARKLKPHTRSLILAGLFIAILQADLGSLGNYFKALFEYRALDLQYMQKLMLCLGFFSFFYWRANNTSSPLIRFLASVSFAVYFIHPFLLLWIGPFVRAFDLPAWQLWLLFPVCTFIIFGASIEVTRLIKHVFGTRSRYAVGA